MFFNTQKTEDLIVRNLNKQKLTGPEIILMIRKIKPKITRQAIYLSLRKLVKEEVINKVNKTFYLNSLWVNKLDSFVKKYNKSEIQDFGIHNLQEEDSLEFNFQNPKLMDVYWGHIFDTIYQSTDPRKVIFLYHYHQWLMIARQHTEKPFFDRCEKEKRLHCVVIGGNTSLDAQFKKDFSTEFNKINVDQKITKAANVYYSVIDDFIFEIKLAKKFQDAINKLYEENLETNDFFVHKLKKITEKNMKVNLKIIKNSKKALALKKKLSKDFYIPSGYML